MAEINSSNREIKTYSVRHHRFDPVTNHFRWFEIKSFDNEKEMNALLDVLSEDLKQRNEKGEAHPKEQFAGSFFDPKRFRKHSNISQYYPDNNPPVYNLRVFSKFFAILRDAKFKKS